MNGGAAISDGAGFYRESALICHARISLAMVLAAALAAPVCAMASDDEPAEQQLVSATGDLNGDGIADLVVAEAPEGGSGVHRLVVLLGRADGSFARIPSQYSVGEARSIVVGDFDGDGRLDVIVGDAGGRLVEFIGDGKGNLKSRGSVAAAGDVVSMATGHFTKSGNLDLVVSDLQSNAAVIFLGDGKGGFQRAWSFQLPRKGRKFSIATADVNRDGIADLLIATDEDEDYQVMLGHDNGTFTYAPELSHVRDPNSYCPS